MSKRKTGDRKRKVDKLIRTNAQAVATSRRPQFGMLEEKSIKHEGSFKKMNPAG